MSDQESTLPQPSDADNARLIQERDDALDALTKCERELDAARSQGVRARAESRAETARQFTEAIVHGDDEHRAWLREAAEAFIAGAPMPPPRSRLRPPTATGVDRDIAQRIRER